MNVFETIKSFIDKIFKPPITFLELAAEKLQDVQLVTAQGLNLGKYLAVFGDMPMAWQLVVSSLFMSTVLLGTLLIFRSIMRMYYAIKEGVHYW